MKVCRISWCPFDINGHFFQIILLFAIIWHYGLQYQYPRMQCKTFLPSPNCLQPVHALFRLFLAMHKSWSELIQPFAFFSFNPGMLDSLKHHKDDVAMVTKEMECGVMFQEPLDYLPGDTILCYEVRQEQQTVDWDLDFWETVINDDAREMTKVC